VCRSLNLLPFWVWVGSWKEGRRSEQRDAVLNTEGERVVDGDRKASEYLSRTISSV
jgi:hypothetical protein